MRELDYTAMKTLQFVAGLQNPTLLEVRLRMIHRDSQADYTSLTIEDLVNERENFAALQADSTEMEGTHDIHAVKRKR
ncbi:unnamed protein product [Strongylus vulgaris]|uniref:Uncharacterized protein n=1 Tax=Strongylus vulgaris TaxID=40348 RepID=A0A3P7IKD2_STRVU|nr:unnamed protein product [Strongylus vulgaris]